MATSAANYPFSSASGFTDENLTGGPPRQETGPNIGDSNSNSNTGADASAPRSGEDLLGRVVQGAHSTIDRLAETAAPHVHHLQEGVASANETLHSRAGQVREISDEWAEGLRTKVRENPLAAVATALALGLLIARINR